jgi:holo-[acyl-carrier protein] synthase
MIAGLGIDVVEIERIRRARERHGARFLEKVFTPGELAVCLKRATPDEALAARFAAKEAAMKALGSGWGEGVGWQDIEIESQPGGAPLLRLHGGAASLAQKLGAKTFWVSLTHAKNTAAAVVALETDGQGEGRT